MSGKIIKELAQCTINSPLLIAQLKALGFETKNPDGMTFEEAIICAQISNAVKGDLDAYKAVIGKTEEKLSPLEQFIIDNSEDDLID